MVAKSFFRVNFCRFRGKKTAVLVMVLVVPDGPSSEGNKLETGPVVC